MQMMKGERHTSHKRVSDRSGSPTSATGQREWAQCMTTYTHARLTSLAILFQWICGHFAEHAALFQVEEVQFKEGDFFTLK